nr:unnamed protein product [Callosobruchus chinensis]
MESGSEQYFDSVEEFSDFTKSESVASLSTEKPFDEDEITEDDIIPYYDKATSKSEMELNKLELLKKRQQYGIKASLANRIRMVEIKALRDLENEIEESKIVCK